MFILKKRPGVKNTPNDLEEMHHLSAPNKNAPIIGSFNLRYNLTVSIYDTFINI